MTSEFRVGQIQAPSNERVLTCLSLLTTWILMFEVIGVSSRYLYPRIKRRREYIRKKKDQLSLKVLRGTTPDEVESLIKQGDYQRAYDAIL